MSIPIPSGVQPDLVFYYNVEVNNVVTQTELGNSGLLQTRDTPIYSEPELKNIIGDFVSQQTLFDTNSTKNLYPCLGPNVYYLPQGSIQIANNLARTKNSAGAFTNPSGTYVFGIDSGYGDFLNTTGIVVLNAVESLREVLVYFNK
jgi:hypothetical protein